MGSARNAPEARKSPGASPGLAAYTASVRERDGMAGMISVIRIDGLGPGIEAGLTTGERNFRRAEAGSDPSVAEAYAALDAYALAFGGWLGVEQVHGANVLDASTALERRDGPQGGRLAVEADGIVLRRAEEGRARLLTVTVADCVPVYLVWPAGYGLLHVGWRGAAAGILEAGLRESRAAVEEIRLHLGPAIGRCCYEVGPEVVRALYGRRGGPAAGLESGALRPGRGDRWMVDLRRVLAERAAASGVRPTAVTSSSCCTACDSRCHSFRASGGRVARQLMLAFIGSRS